MRILPCGALGGAPMTLPTRNCAPSSVPRQCDCAAAAVHRHSLSATTNDHHGAALAPSRPSQYHADTSGQLPPRWSRMTSHTLSRSAPWLARKQPIAAPDASFLTGIGVTL